jgi:hypothetical protein
LDYGSEFHAIVSGSFFTTEHLAGVFPETQHTGPTSRSGIANARAVRGQLDLFLGIHAADFIWPVRAATTNICEKRGGLL